MSSWPPFGWVVGSPSPASSAANYQQVTLGSFITEVSTALNDPTNVFWSATEIQYAIHESLLLWGALTSRWVERGTLQANTNQPLYLLPTYLPSLRRRTFTYDQMARELQYHLAEPSAGESGAGMTGQIPISSLLSALLTARNRFVFETGVPLTWSSLPLTTASQSEVVDLPETVSLLQRLTWSTPGNLTSRLWSTDTFQAKSARPSYPQSPSTPRAYSKVDLPGNQIRLIPPPADTGSLHMIYADSQSSASGLLALPDELAHAAKYLALYLLLSTSGPAYDPIRAQYALERYKLYTDEQLRDSVIAAAFINGTPASISTFDDLDKTKPYWQSMSGTPTQIASAYDLIGLYKPPYSSSFSVSLDVSRSAYLPTSTTDYLPISRDELTYIFDMTRHILSFKIGGAEFLSTMPLHDSFLSGANKRNTLNSINARYLTQMFEQSQKQQNQTPGT